MCIRDSANSIKKRLSKIEGVNDVVVQVELGIVEVHRTPDSSLEQIVQALNAMGYAKKGQSTVLQKGKSYISCAIGKMNS